MEARGTAAIAKPRSDPVPRDRGGPDRLIEVAEDLFGRHGLDGVSMRQVQLAAGSSNKFVVQYHFGGLDGLAEAILARRMPMVDARQAALLADVEARGADTDVRALFDALLRPLLEQVNIAGERSYARFVSALLRSAEGERYCATLFHLTPTTGRILALLRGALPDVPPGLLMERLRLLSGMVCASIFNRTTAVRENEPDATLIDDALDVAAAGLGCRHDSRSLGGV